MTYAQKISTFFLKKYHKSIRKNAKDLSKNGLNKFKPQFTTAKKRWLKWKWLTHQMLAKIWRNWNSITHWTLKCYNLFGKYLGVSSKTRYTHTIWHSSSNFIRAFTQEKWKHMCMQRHIYTYVHNSSIQLLFIIAKTWKWHKRPSKDELINCGPSV